MQPNPIGSLAQYHHPPFSDVAYEKAVAFQPRSNDVFVTTPPKTGTTLLQYACHLLRATTTATEGGSWSEAATSFEDVYQIAPWAMMAWDLGFDLTDPTYEQCCPHNPAIPYPARVFKSHQRLYAMNPGAKYVVAVRNPKSVLVSWFNFLKSHDAPPLRAYATASKFALDKDFFADGMRFGASLWEYYREYISCLERDDVLVVVYEDFAKDIRGHLPALARFMGFAALSNETLDTIAKLCSKEAMMEAGSKFDESWVHQRLIALGRCLDPESFNPVARVTSGADPSTLDETALSFLAHKWQTGIEKETGIKDYAGLVQRARAEYARR